MGITKPTVFVVDDDDGVRSMLVASFEHHAIPVKDYSSADGFLQDYNNDNPGCLVLDLSMPNMNGLELQQELVNRNILIPIIFITGDADIPQTVQALKAGAVDFLEKPFRVEMLVELVKEAFNKDEAIRAEQLLNETIQTKLARLTGREQQVLHLLVSGSASLSNKEIARELNISHRTVDHHRARIMEKTGASSITELARMVDTAGIGAT